MDNCSAYHGAEQPCKNNVNIVLTIKLYILYPNPNTKELWTHRTKVLLTFL